MINLAEILKNKGERAGGGINRRNPVTQLSPRSRRLSVPRKPDGSTQSSSGLHVDATDNDNATFRTC